MWTKAEVKALAKVWWGLPKAQWRCLDLLNLKESRWDYQASGSKTRLGRAYGIGQALPARKMRIAGKDYMTNPVTQIMWQKIYIERRYSGNPCYAWRHERRHNWY